MALARSVTFHRSGLIQSGLTRFGIMGIGLACLAALTTGCVSTTEKLTGSPLGLSRNYPLNAPGAQSGRKKPNAGMYLSYAKLKESEGDLPEARTSYDQVLAQNPKSVDAILGIARLELLSGRSDGPEKAEKGYLRALKLEPRSPQVLDALGQFYASQARWDEAIRTLNQAMLAAPEEKAYRHHLAIALAKSGKIDEALPHFVQAVGPAAAHYNIGLILHDKGDVKGSEEQFVMAVLKNPKLEQAQYWLDEIRREQEPQVASSNAPASVPGNAAAGNPAAGNRVASYQPQGRASLPGARPAQPAANATSRTPQNPGYQPQSAASPRITAGPSPQDSQTWPAANGQPPAQRNVQRPAQQTPGVEQFAARNRMGTALLPASENIPSGVTLQQWEQWNNQRGLSNPPTAAQAPFANNAASGTALR